MENISTGCADDLPTHFDFFLKLPKIQKCQHSFQWLDFAQNSTTYFIYQPKLRPDGYGHLLWDQVNQHYVKSNMSSVAFRKIVQVIQIQNVMESGKRAQNNLGQRRLCMHLQLTGRIHGPGPAPGSRSGASPAHVSFLVVIYVCIIYISPSQSASFLFKIQ